MDKCDLLVTYLFIYVAQSFSTDHLTTAERLNYTKVTTKEEAKQNLSEVRKELSQV